MMYNICDILYAFKRHKAKCGINRRLIDVVEIVFCELKERYQKVRVPSYTYMNGKIWILQLKKEKIQFFIFRIRVGVAITSPSSRTKSFFSSRGIQFGFHLWRIRTTAPPFSIPYTFFFHFIDFFFLYFYVAL